MGSCLNFADLLYEAFAVTSSATALMRSSTFPDPINISLSPDRQKLPFNKYPSHGDYRFDMFLLDS
jgi:hypothetical protein